MKSLAIGLMALLLPALANGADKRAMTIGDLFRLQRVADPQISPDGKTVAYVVTRIDLPGNSSSSSIWLAPAVGGAPRPLTNTTKRDRHPRWSPDSKRILFESNRSGSSQLWVIDIGGGEARQLTSLSTGAGTGRWSPDGKHIAFVSAVYPDFSEKPFKESDALNKKKADEIEQNPVKAKVFTRLFYRHWDSYVEDKRQHLFVMPAEGGEPRDITPGDRDAVPTSMTFETGDNFTFSPDGKHLVFTAVPEKGEAWSTNCDICRAPISGGTVKWECLTKDNLAADSGPAFSPDGKKLAYRAQKKAGYEADRWELMVAACDESGAIQEAPRSVTPEFDSSVDEYAWAGNAALLFQADEKARKPVWLVSLQSGKVEHAEPELGLHWGTSSSLSVSRDGSAAWLLASMDAPPRVYTRTVAESGQAVVNTIDPNKDTLAAIDRPRPESVTVPGAGGTPMQMWILKPPGFDESKKWPVAYLVHGGPQGAWEDGWSWRWVPELWAAQGYVVALPNPRGSTGFGQKYIDEITGDWGGKCYEDLMKGVDYVENLPYVDKDRIAAAGASFGGYMVNWFAVNTGRFKCLITHCSVWNFDSMYGTTDEIWFDEYEHGGPPWGKNRNSYEKHSPHRKAVMLGKFRTPMLVIHNDLDFRCPIGQGHELFTALQRQGVPSRFINFPNEGHWVTKPKNSEYWHREVFAWLKKHVPPGGR